MRNPFLLLALAAAGMAMMPNKRPACEFNWMRADRSKRRVAMDKRDARKARNRSRA